MPDRLLFVVFGSICVCGLFAFVGCDADDAEILFTGFLIVVDQCWGDEKV